MNTFSRCLINWLFVCYLSATVHCVSIGLKPSVGVHESIGYHHLNNMLIFILGLLAMAAIKSGIYKLSNNYYVSLTLDRIKDLCKITSLPFYSDYRENHITSFSIMIPGTKYKDF
jgi:hypothetical protein